MRIAIVLLCVACGKQAEPPVASGSGSAGSATPTGSAAPAGSASITPPDQDHATIRTPFAIKRSHKAGQRYKLHMERVSTDFGTTTFDATATVKSAAGSKATFDLVIEQIVSPEQTTKKAVLTVSGDFGEHPHADAEQTGGPSVELYLTPIEHMMGDICSPPTTAHLVGDTWTENVTTWKFVAYSSVRDELRGTFEATTKDNWRTSLSLATDDGFTGTCTVVEPTTTWKLVVAKG